MKLVATEVYYHPNDENQCATVGFKGDDGTYLLASRALTPTEQDRRLGHDAVHIELSDQGFSCYDGIAAIAVYPTMLRFDLNESVVRDFRQTHIEVYHDLPSERLWQMRQVLITIFDGHPRYADAG